MLEIQKNTDDNFTSIIAIAHEVWPVAYGAILSPEQLEYMMKMMYSVSSLQLQAGTKKHRFIVAKREDDIVGFASYEFNFSKKPKTKIHKIYVLTTEQGKGIGVKLMDFITNEAKKTHQKTLILNVNKNNKAVRFYESLGFSISFEEIIAIGNGYVMDDYVMEKPI